MKRYLSMAVAGGAAIATAVLLISSGGSAAETASPATAAVEPEAGSGTDRSSSPARATPTGRKKPEKKRGTVFRVRNTPFGKVLHDKKTGLAAYMFTREKRGGKPRCYGGCADAWPPVKTKGRPVAGKGVSQKKLGTVKRRGGGRMVTYAGRPLYFYVDDKPGLILCDDVVEYGGRWLVIGPDGKPASG